MVFPEIYEYISCRTKCKRKLTNRTMAAARVLCAMALVAIAVVVDVGESVDDALE